MRKYGTSEDQVIIPEDQDIKATASQEQREQLLAEVKAEADQEDE